MKLISTHSFHNWSIVTHPLWRILFGVVTPTVFLLSFQFIRVFQFVPGFNYLPQQWQGIQKIHKIETEYGELKYSIKYEKFWATSYNHTCEGCSMTTATGMTQGYGIVAVDPKVIPLLSKLYIPGYGIAIAGDVGGAIKGRRIDLGFDVLDGSFSSGPMDVYVLVDAQDVPITRIQPSLGYPTR